MWRRPNFVLCFCATAHFKEASGPFHLAVRLRDLKIQVQIISSLTSVCLSVPLDIVFVLFREA